MEDQRGLIGGPLLYLQTVFGKNMINKQKMVQKRVCQTCDLSVVYAYHTITTL